MQTVNFPGCFIPVSPEHLYTCIGSYSLSSFLLLLLCLVCYFASCSRKSLIFFLELNQKHWWRCVASLQWSSHFILPSHSLGSSGALLKTQNFLLPKQGEVVYFRSSVVGREAILSTESQNIHVSQLSPRSSRILSGSSHSNVIRNTYLLGNMTGNSDVYLIAF